MNQQNPIPTAVQAPLTIRKRRAGPAKGDVPEIPAAAETEEVYQLTMTEALWAQVMALAPWDEKQLFLLENIYMGSKTNRHNVKMPLPWNQCNRAFKLAASHFRIIVMETTGQKKQRFVCVGTTDQNLASKEGDRPIRMGELDVYNYMTPFKPKPRVHECDHPNASSYGGATTDTFFGRKVLVA